MENANISEKSERIKKLEALKKIGINPYPSKTNRTHSILEIKKNFEVFNSSKKEIIITGRIMTIRSHGNLTFAHLKDGGEKIQIALSKNEIGLVEKYKIFLKLVDIGDFIEIRGTCFITHKGEKSIMAKEWKMLAKAIMPLPEKYHGLSNEEELLRKRYLDILFNDETKNLFLKRSLFWRSMREFLINKDFLEVETPILENVFGGADAKPFITHHNSLDIDVYLRISMGELWQKRLMVAGFEKTFEIGRQFRNEGMSSEHLQEYTQMEFYWAYADYEQGMELVKEMYRYIIEKTFGKFDFKIKNFEINFGKEWEIYDYREIIFEMTAIDILNTSLEQIEKKLIKLNINYDKNGFNITRAIDNLWKYCRKNIGGPGFLINVPTFMEPLAKRKEDNPNLVERFQVIIAGSENGKGYSELNDPIDQAERLVAQQALRDAGDEEAQMFDQEFIEALEYGMPPTFGFGVSERLFAFLMNRSVRECQIFPLLKPKK